MERAMEPHPSTLICASHFMLAAGQIYSQHCRTLHDKTSMSRVVNNCKEQSQILSRRVKFLYTAVLFDAKSLEFRNSIFLQKLFWPSLRKKHGSDREKV